MAARKRSARKRTTRLPARSKTTGRFLKRGSATKSRARKSSKRRRR